MEVLAAVGLASATVQFVDFSTRLIGFARGIHDSTSGMTEENNNLELVASKMNQFSLDLENLMDGQNQTRDQKALVELAVTCRTIAKEIVKILEKIKPKDLNSKSQSLKAAFKHLRYEKEISGLESRLANCRSQLQIQLDGLYSSEIKSRLDNLVKSSLEHTKELEKIQGLYRKMKTDETTMSLSDTAQEQLKKLLDLSENTCRSITQYRILNALAVKTMDRRFDSVEVAHANTFEWIWSQDSAAETNKDHTVSEPFLNWLKSGDGAFHISGKLGSGKSTLMKFLCEHKRTKQELKKWAGSRKLVFEKFFFWKLGEDAEKSLDGLFRSLLYSTLKSCPELISQILPDQWEQVKVVPWQVKAQIKLDSKALRSAFDRLIAVNQHHQKYCFCYFIDGLDEYEERREDFKDMIKLLLGWTSADVKICVSSREYPVFLDAFSIRKRLRLQDLTRRDMATYVFDRLGLVSEGKSLRLVREIVDKSSGIFLWLTLVIKLYRQHMNNGSDVFELDELLLELPSEIEDLFRFLLHSLDKLSRKKAYQTFAMVLACPHTLPLSLLGYSFFEEIEKNPDFAIQEVFPFENLENSEHLERMEMARKRVNGYCKGLVEVLPHRLLGKGELPGHSVKPYALGLEFTHRSIPDFLANEASSPMERALDGLSATDSVAQIWLAHIRALRQDSLTRDQLCEIVYAILGLVAGGKIDASPHTFLERLSSAVLWLGPLDEAHLVGNKIIETGFEIFLGEEDYMAMTAVTSPFHLSAYSGLTTYAYWIVNNNAAMIHSKDETNLVLWSLVGLEHTVATCNHFKLLCLFLSQGLPPQAVLENSYYGTENTPWVYFLDSILGEILQDISNFSNEKRGLLADTIEKFVDCGADPSVLFSATTEISEEGLAQNTCVMHFAVRSSLDQELRRISAKLYAHPNIFELITKNGGTISVRELIKYYKFYNEERIMQLWDRNIAAQGKESSLKLTRVKDITNSSEDSAIEGTLTPEAPENLPSEDDASLPPNTPPHINGTPVVVEGRDQQQTESEAKFETLPQHTPSWVRLLDVKFWNYLLGFLFAFVGILVAILIRR